MHNCMSVGQDGGHPGLLADVMIRLVSILFEDTNCNWDVPQ